MQNKDLEADAEPMVENTRHDTENSAAKSDSAISPNRSPGAGEPIEPGTTPVLNPEQLADNFERIVTLNHQGSGLSRPGFSRLALQVISALAGVAALFLVYCCARLMV